MLDGESEPRADLFHSVDPKRLFSKTARQPEKGTLFLLLLQSRKLKRAESPATWPPRSCAAGHVLTNTPSLGFVYNPQAWEDGNATAIRPWQKND